MNETAILEIPKDVYDDLLRAASDLGKSPAEWISDRVGIANGRATPRRMPTQDEIDEANRRLRETRVSLGYATGTNNEDIDRDLAREYGDNHENDSKPS